MRFFRGGQRVVCLLASLQRVCCEASMFRAGTSRCLSSTIQAKCALKAVDVHLFSVCQVTSIAKAVFLRTDP